MCDLRHNYQRPHGASQPGWRAIKNLYEEHGEVRLDHFHLLRRLGAGDVGSVFLCEIKQPATAAAAKKKNDDVEFGGCYYYAMKVVDRESLRVKKKVKRADVERQVLSQLDHPFLPTLYATFDAYHYSCFLMDYCHGGDLFKLQHHLPNLRFSISAAKFYGAEVLVALEYLHQKGIIYRDLKPENVLIQQDGHVMLSDFDLSFYTEAHPKLLTKKTTNNNHINNDKIHPIMCCHGTTDQINMDVIIKKKKKISSDSARADVELELSAEPMGARSTSFVGTHEYLAPEVILGLGHGSAVDWWAYGVFLYELMYGITPFKGSDDKNTMRNIVGTKAIRFPRLSEIARDEKERHEMLKAQDLIRKLLVRDPEKRKGYTRGSCEIKRHEFFRGINWALIRSTKPPVVPRDDENFNVSSLVSSFKQKATIQTTHHDKVDFF